MKFGTILALVFAVLCTFSATGCTTRSPAVDLYNEFKAKVVDEDYSGAHAMLAENGKPDLAAFEEGMKGDWGKWFSGNSQLREIARVGNEKNMIGGDLVAAGEENASIEDRERQAGAFVIYRTSESSDWKILWKLGTTSGGATDGTPVAQK